MSDVTNDWAGGNRSSDAGADPTRPAAGGDRLVPDTGEHTPPTATAPAAEPKSFDSSGATKTLPQSGEAEEPLLRATLETIRVKAEELRGQAREWTKIRQEQAIDLIDEKPVTAVAAAFGVGLVIGALLSR